MKINPLKDDEGRSDNERLAEEGVAGAEHDQMVQAARAAASADSREAQPLWTSSEDK